MPDLELPHDDRLKNVKPSQYRIWRDGQNVLIPVGKSITNPLVKEIAQVNTDCYAPIHKGFFTKPTVDFTSTTANNIKRFDRFYLQTWRDELPIDNPDIDYNDDLNLRAVWVRLRSLFECNGDNGINEDEIAFHFVENQTWRTNKMPFNKFGITGLRGEYFLVTNPTDEMKSFGKNFDTGLTLHIGILPVTLIVTEAYYFNGHSEIKLLTKNAIFELTQTTTFEILGGE